ncbi:uncharacterized protein ARMOST_15120 [Armillaria ostoyae]|uniref:Uncharacterized protein n=1 Tax=Armillaria ostoyae TaxID=47428 RepID=A0A284RSH3_ARMOS|nr:uncharacterized protein ARMOST_15120 [Armillaria ostoyae]
MDNEGAKRIAQKEAASEFQTRLELRPPPSSTFVYTTTTFTTPLPLFHLKLMSEPSKAIDPLVEAMDPAHRRLYEQVLTQKANLKRELQLTLSSLFVNVLQSAEGKLAMTEDCRQKESVLRALAAEIERFKPGMLQLFGEDSDAYRHLLLEEQLASHR